MEEQKDEKEVVKQELEEKELEQAAGGFKGHGDRPGGNIQLCDKYKFIP